MLTKKGLEFILHITDYFHGHWEDPNWGKKLKNQALIMLAIDELANGIADKEEAKEIRSIVNESIANIAYQVASTQDPIPAAPKESLEFILHITDYFHGHWEDPNWGRKHDALIMLAIDELAKGLVDEKATEIRSTVNKSMKKNITGHGLLPK